MKNRTITVLVFLTALATTPLFAQTESEPIYSKLPVKEVTIFKDGHAFVLHEGMAQTNEKGDVVLDQLPKPIMGTFWAYSANNKAKLTCVISSRDSIETKTTAGTITDLLKANLHTQVLIKETGLQQHYQAEIINVLNNQLVLLKLHEGTKAMAVSLIQNITFLENPADTITQTVTRETLTFKLKRNTQEQIEQTKVGMAYIQKGIRWIPNYRVEIDGKGKAVIKLQGTIINELADLENVNAHLVIGVPRFAFKNTPDPISFQKTIARLSRHFNPNSSTAYAFSNAIRSQARFTEMPQMNTEAENVGPELSGMESNEDLFVFDLNNVSLKKGQRMVIPIAEYTVPYSDIYAVDLSFAPPLEMRRNFNTNQHLQLAKLFHAPKAMHKIRLVNNAEYPLTTAPATILKDGRILAQGMMTYTSIGGTSDLEITTAVNIKVKNADKQTEATPNAAKWNGNSYTKINMVGTIELTNYGDKPVTLHVKRTVMGKIDTTANKGIVKQLGHGYDGFAFEGGTPFWWNWCNWPWWWYRFNSIGQTDWDIELQPKEEIKLEYNWHYYWQ